MLDTPMIEVSAVSVIRVLLSLAGLTRRNAPQQA
jgi:hypothetical protein